jgi:hypothetical protein
MSIRIHIAAGLALLSAATAASAQEAVLPLLTVEVRYVVDCGHRSLPSQQDVANWTGQSNFSQVYATRQRLMSEVGRACQQAGVGQVQLVQRPGARRDDTRFAVAALRR